MADKPITQEFDEVLSGVDLSELPPLPSDGAERHDAYLMNQGSKPMIDELKELKRLRDAATPGEWVRSNEGTGIRNRDDGDFVFLSANSDLRYMLSTADGKFIAAAGNLDLDALIAWVEGLQAENERLQSENRELRGELLRTSQKSQHGCSDAFCDECDGAEALPEWRLLKAGETIQEGDEVDSSAPDGWRDDPVWTPTRNVGGKAPDPRFPAHRIYRRRV